MSKRRTARDLALRVLYEIEVGRFTAEDAIETSEEEARPSAEDAAYVREMVPAVMGEVDRLDGIIAELAEGWKLDRLAKVDKNVLRLALYELDHKPELPASMVINDAVEIAKKYSTDDSGRFVNGILGNYVRRRGAAA